MQRKNLLLLLLLAMLWGPSFLFIKVAVAEVPPITFVFTRVALAAALLFLLLRQQKRRLPPPGRIWLYLAIVAFFQISLPFVLVGWARMTVKMGVKLFRIEATALSMNCSAQPTSTKGRLIWKKATMAR